MREWEKLPIVTAVLRSEVKKGIVEALYILLSMVVTPYGMVNIFGCFHFQARSVRLATKQQLYRITLGRLRYERNYC
jgi:hypothetical protein